MCSRHSGFSWKVVSRAIGKARSRALNVAHRAVRVILKVFRGHVVLLLEFLVATEARGRGTTVADITSGYLEPDNRRAAVCIRGGGEREIKWFIDKDSSRGARMRIARRQ